MPVMSWSRLHGPNRCIKQQHTLLTLPVGCSTALYACPLSAPIVPADSAGREIVRRGRPGKYAPASCALASLPPPRHAMRIPQPSLAARPRAIQVSGNLLADRSYLRVVLFGRVGIDTVKSQITVALAQKDAINKQHVKMQAQIQC